MIFFRSESKKFGLTLLSFTKEERRNRARAICSPFFYFMLKATNPEVFHTRFYLRLHPLWFYSFKSQESHNDEHLNHKALRYPLMKLGKEGAENLTTFIEQKITDELESKSQLLATKEDLYQLRSEVKESKSETIKWMFIFWLGQVVATFGFILLFLKK